MLGFNGTDLFVFENWTFEEIKGVLNQNSLEDVKFLLICKTKKNLQFVKQQQKTA
jgi:hypothetical protein